MVKIDQRIISEFDKLIEIFEDEQKAYRLAAKRQKGYELRFLFNQFSDNKAQFKAEIRNEILRLSGNPYFSIASTGTAPRNEVFTKAVAARNDSAAIIAECEKQEEVILRAYERVLKRDDLPVSLRKLLEQQYVKLQKASEKIHSLKHQRNEPERSRACG